MLNADPSGAVKALLAHCGLAPADLARVMQVFAKDSQEGTQISRGHRTTGFTPEQDRRFLALLARVAPDLAADLVLRP